jgi:geranylgeranylglycerol-phosphate geranylgeranyltransferase
MERERYWYFYLSPDYTTVPKTRSSPLKVLRVYLSQNLIPYHLFPVYQTLVFVGAALAAYGRPVDAAVLPGIVVTVSASVLLLLAMFLFDDIGDRKADEIAHPERPLPSGAIELRHAWTIALGCAGLAIALNVWLGPSAARAMLAYAILGLVLMAVQGRVPMPAFGEITTPLLWGVMPLYFFWVLNPGEMRYGLLLAAFHYLADLSSDIPGGARDQAGDRRQGVRTFAMMLGPSRAIHVAVLLLAVGLVPLFVFFRVRDMPTIAYVLQGLVFLWTIVPHLRAAREPTVKALTVANHAGYHYMCLSYIIMAIVLLGRSLVG